MNLNLPSYRFRLFSRRDPMRDWFTLLVGAAIALAVIVVWNAWMFDTVANGGTIGPVATSTPPVFDQTSLGAIHAIFDKRAAEEAKYVDSTYHFADPSQ